MSGLFLVGWSLFLAGSRTVSWVLFLVCLTSLLGWALGLVGVVVGLKQEVRGNQWLLVTLMDHPIKVTIAIIESQTPVGGSVDARDNVGIGGGVGEGKDWAGLFRNGSDHHRSRCYCTLQSPTNGFISKLHTVQ